MKKVKINLLTDRDQVKLDKRLKADREKWQVVLDKAALNTQLHGLPAGNIK